MKRLLSPSSKTSQLLSKIWFEALKNKKNQQVPFVLDYRKFEKRDLDRLKNSGFLDYKQDKKGFLIDLTKDGIIQAVVGEIEKTIPFDNEDTVCMVVFDIPERFLKERNFFRNFLDRCGFFSIQKSVFITTFNAVKPISDFVELSGLSKWVRVFEATER